MSVALLPMLQQCGWDQSTLKKRNYEQYSSEAPWNVIGRKPELLFEANCKNRIAAAFMSQGRSSSWVPSSFPCQSFFSIFFFKAPSPFFFQCFLILLYTSRNIFDTSEWLSLHICHCALFFPFPDVCIFKGFHCLEAIISQKKKKRRRGIFKLLFLKHK